MVGRSRAAASRARSWQEALAAIADGKPRLLDFGGSERAGLGSSGSPGGARCTSSLSGSTDAALSSPGKPSPRPRAGSQAELRDQTFKSGRGGLCNRPRLRRKEISLSTIPSWRAINTRSDDGHDHPVETPTAPFFIEGLKPPPMRCLASAAVQIGPAAGRDGGVAGLAVTIIDPRQRPVPARRDFPASPLDRMQTRRSDVNAGPPHGDRGRDPRSQIDDPRAHLGDAVGRLLHRRLGSRKDARRACAAGRSASAERDLARIHGPVGRHRRPLAGPR